jgi:hypothetical protein
MLAPHIPLRSMRATVLRQPYGPRETHLMTKFLEQPRRQVEQLSEREQNAAGAALIDYLAHCNDMQLPGARLAEVRGRRADSERKLVWRVEAKERQIRLQ